MPIASGFQELEFSATGETGILTMEDLAGKNIRTGVVHCQVKRCDEKGNFFASIIEPVSHVECTRTD